MREPEPGEFPLDPEAGSRSDRPLYDINRADLHIGYALFSILLIIEYLNMLKKLVLIAIWERLLTNTSKRKIELESLLKDSEWRQIY